MHAPALAGSPSDPVALLPTFGRLPPAVVALLRMAHARHIGQALHYRQQLAGGRLDLAETYREHEAKELAQADAIMDALCSAAIPPGFGDAAENVR